MSEEEVIDFFRPFEEEIVEKFKAPKQFGVGGIGGRSAPRKGPWIRGYLETVEEDYLLNIFYKWKDFTTRANTFKETKLEPGTYQEFKTFFWLLEKHGLVKFTRQEPALKRGYIPKHFYKLVDQQKDNPLWLNPHSTYID